MVDPLLWPWSSPWILVFHMALYLWSTHGLVSLRAFVFLLDLVFTSDLGSSTRILHDNTMYLYWKYKLPRIDHLHGLVHIHMAFTLHMDFTSVWSSTWPCTHIDLTSTQPGYMGLRFYIDMCSSDLFSASV